MRLHDKVVDFRNEYGKIIRINLSELEGAGVAPSETFRYKVFTDGTISDKKQDAVIPVRPTYEFLREALSPAQKILRDEQRKLSYKENYKPKPKKFKLLKITKGGALAVAPELPSGNLKNKDRRITLNCRSMFKDIEIVLNINDKVNIRDVEKPDTIIGTGYVAKLNRKSLMVATEDTLEIFVIEARTFEHLGTRYWSYPVRDRIVMLDGS